MPAGVVPVAFVVHCVVVVGTALLFLGFGLITRRRLGVSAPLWIAAVMLLHWALGLLHPGWNVQLADRFMTDTPPIETTVGAAVTVVSLGSALLYSTALLLLFAITMAELLHSTCNWVDWGHGRFIAWLGALVPIKTQLCVAALALAALGSLGPGVIVLMLSE